MYMGTPVSSRVITVNTSITPIWPTGGKRLPECTQSENVRTGAAVMLKEYGLNYEKRHTKQGIQPT